jgi:ABC-2 type transport system permease protein
VLFLFVLGTGLSTLAGKGMPPGISFKTILYPGVLAMSVLFTALWGIIILALAGAAPVPYDPILFLTVIGELLSLSFTLTAFGVMMAARIKQMPAFMALTQMLVMPLFFLSGALSAERAPGVSWGGWEVPVGLSLGIVALMGAALLGIAIAEFQRTE